LFVINLIFSNSEFSELSLIFVFNHLCIFFFYDEIIYLEVSFEKNKITLTKENFVLVKLLIPLMLVSAFYSSHASI